MRNGTSLAWGIALAACSVIACSGSTTTRDENGTGGSATTGGSGGKQGSGGAGGAGGNAGVTGSGGSSGATGSGGGAGQAGTGGKAGAAGTGGGSAGTGGSSGCDCVEAEVSWGRDGGFVAYSESSTVKPCRAYTHTREPRGGGGMPITCTMELFGCGVDSLGVGDLTAALAHPDMVAALGRAPILYGRDTRPVDGQVFQIRVGGRLVEVGAECTTSAPNCPAIPAGVRSAMQLLVRLDSQQLGISPCREQFPQP